MATLGELVVKVNADISGLQKGLDNATGALRRMSSEIASVGRTLTIGVTLPIVALGASTVTAAAQMDSLTRGLTAVAGSSAKAQEQLKRLEDVAKLPGLGFREAIQGSIRLQAAGLNVALAERSLRSFGNAIALTGGGKQQLDTITTQLGQLAAKGRVLGSDLRPIIEAAPAVGEALRKAFGTVDPEQIQKLHLSTDQFLTLLLNQLDRLPHVAGGAANSFENLEDAIFKARVAIGEKLLPVIVPLIEGLSSMLEKVRTLDPNTVKWGLAIAGVAAVAGPLILIISSLTTAVTALAGALAIGLLPVIAVGGPILIALAALSAMWAKNKLDALAAAAAADAYRASLIGLTEGQLISERTAASLRLSELRANEAAMIAAHRAIMPRPGGGARGTLSASSVGAPMNTPEFQTIVDRANEAAAKVSSLTQALDRLHATTAQAPAAPLVPPAGGRDKLAGLLDGLQDRIREFEQLQKFRGALSINVLPDDAQEQIRLVNTLAGELDTLRDGLLKFQAAGRTPPAGLTFGIEQLSQQLFLAEVRLGKLAGRFNDIRMLGNVEIQVTPTPFVPLSGVAQDRMNVPASGLGSIFGPKGGGVDFSALVGDSLRGIGDGLKNAFSGFIAQLGPAAFSFKAINAVLAPLQPLLDALLVPFTIMGEILASLIVPVLKVLFQPLKLLGIVVSYIGEVIAKVAGAIANAIGQLVRGIGRLVNKLPGSPGDPLVKAGQAMIDLGKQFRNAADDMRDKRKELEKLSFEDALDKTKDAADRLTESMLNAVQGFKIAGFRFAAMEGRTSGAVPQASTNANVSAAVGDNVVQIGEVHLHAAEGDDVEDLWRKLKAIIQRESRSKLAMRSLAAQIA